MAFGGRTALVTVLAVIAASYGLTDDPAAARQANSASDGHRRTSVLLFFVAAGLFAALDLGTFDKMLLRFSSDKGKHAARALPHSTC